MQSRREREAQDKESALYPDVAKWLKTNHGCFATCINKDVKLSRLDVVGVKDVGGDLSGEIETIVVEVKKGTEPFAKACGQALSYKVYGNRTYLADKRQETFTAQEIQIAGRLGIGLIQINESVCTEILTSPYYEPIETLNLKLLDKVGLGKCQLCGSFFVIGDSNLTTRSLKLAMKDRKALFYFVEGSQKRKSLSGVEHRKITEDETYQKRYLCRDCVAILSKLNYED